ncbi:putative mycofactocin binding protein MftB [Geodermatophilus obscurus]|uniref:Putative mycofactocin binding protein MftB n=1 Tax=Geodermatophilus obscurus TaxID=1861 RepID=A0A1I5GBG0_9ACTN|nr:mycofactocin biosynthesis chaperone MftB [Geodermatophilus obscurus]SFO33173.1 putative mycofactocin binding protein MftB [Geodermatophilus obscurus]
MTSPTAPAAGAPAPAVFDSARPWRRARSVALRPEPFGALAYHFGNRKLSFLKSRTLVTVVQALADHPSADATLVACGVPEVQRPAYVRALADLARSEMIERRTSPPPTARTLGAGPCSEAETNEELL